MPPSKSSGTGTLASQAFLATVLLAALCFVAYFPAAGGDFVWDDNHYVSQNETLRPLEGLKKIWFEPTASPQYYPLVFSTFWLEYHLWGLNPTGYHLVNIACHAAGSILLWRVLRRLGVPGAWLAAAVFALHPVQVESVAWITERKNVLSGLFYWAAFLAYLRFALPPEKAAVSPDIRWPWYLPATVLFLGALLSKTVTCSLPAALLLALWWKRSRVSRAVPLIPFFLLGLAFALVTVELERSHVGAEGEPWDLSWLERCLVAGRALWFYAGKLVWPARLTFIYPRWTIDPNLWWQYAFPLGAVAVVALLWAARRRWGGGPLVGVLFFIGTLVPALGFFSVYPMQYSFVADHFQYLASAGLIALAVAIGTKAYQRVFFPKKWPALVIASALLGTLGVLTYRQCYAYRDLKGLWRDTLAKNPNCWLAHNNLANILAKSGDTDMAIWHWEAAIEADPRFLQPHYSLGILLAQQGKTEQAAEHLKHVLRVHPDYWTNAKSWLADRPDLLRDLERRLELPDVKQPPDGKPTARKP